MDKARERENILSLESSYRVLITGGTGLLGVALQKTAPANVEGFTSYFTKRSSPLALPFNMHRAHISNMKQMQDIFEWVKPDAVIHTAAIGSVDYAEKNKDITREVNVDGTKVVTSLCNKFKSRLIFISSNAVFDGQSPFYSETVPVSPINYYGQLKVEAENIIKGTNMPWAIVRPIMMYGWPYAGGRDNPVVWWIRALKEGKSIKVVDNVFNKPLPAWSCAQSVWAVLQQNRTGIYHAAGRDHVSLYQFALVTAEVFGLDENLITPVPDSYFPEIAPRPKDTSFDTTKMEVELGVKTIGLKDGLVRMKREFSALVN